MSTELFAELPLLDDAISVETFNRAVAGLLQRGFPIVKVRGEIGNFTRASSGHWYFTLKDDVAQVRCVMFRSRNVLAEFQPREGDEVEVRAQAGLYEARGEFQLTIDSVRRAGQGKLFEEFLRIKNRLAAEGVFDESSKRALPRLPAAIGIVTSLQAAALRDVVTTLSRRAAYARLIVYPVPVQGEGAALRIADTLQTVSARAEVDAVLLVRGGGSLEDLWAFNDPVVAYAIRASRVPVVVGVGHESDFTIADFAADLRAPTPTAAAELVAPEQKVLLQWINEQLNRAQLSVQRNWQSSQQRLDFAQRVLVSPQAVLAGLNQRLSYLYLRLSRGVQESVDQRRAQYSDLNTVLIEQRQHHLALGRDLESSRRRLATALQLQVERWQQRLVHLKQALIYLDTPAVLARGFTLTVDQQGHVVSDVARIQVGETLALHFSNGHAQVRVEQKL